MRTTRLLSTTAAILLIGGGIAFAQGMKNDEQPGRAPAAQKNAPAEKIAPQMSTHRTRETTGQGTMSPSTEHSEQNAVPNAENKPASAQEHERHSHTQQQGANADENKASSGKDQSRKMTRQANEKSETNTKTGRTNEKNETNTKTGQANEKNETHTRTGQANEKGESRSTTGQGAAGAAKLSTEQRTRITTIIHRHKVAPVHLNVSVRVGTRVPGHVHLYPLPVEVVDIYPEWRGYDYIMVGDEIVVIDSDSHEIVAILNA